MSRDSYAGGVQWVTAATDSRVDAIAPQIAWHNLLESLIPEGVVRSGWRAVLYGCGQTSVTGGVTPTTPPARGAVVVILSDGWERGDPTLVGREMERLARLAYRIVWVNPRAGADGFSVRAGGMVAALGHCDALVSGHSFAALGEVVEAIAAPSGGSGAARAATLRAAGPSDPEREGEEEEWASATPVPGSSVAMPSGHGPSRGNTTPGWPDDAD